MAETNFHIRPRRQLVRHNRALSKALRDAINGGQLAPAPTMPPRPPMYWKPVLVSLNLLADYWPRKD